MQILPGHQNKKGLVDLNKTNRIKNFYLFCHNIITCFLWKSVDFCSVLEILHHQSVQQYVVHND